jgi:hypothetical protein
MMRLEFALVVLALVFATACRENQDPQGADALWQRISDKSYRSYRRAPGYASRTKSNAPHGNEVEIFVNDTVSKTLDSQGALSWPDGSLIVKEGYDDTSLALVAVMEKRNGEWYWAEYDGEGNTLYSGKPSICVNCHSGSSSDSVLAFSLPR